MIGRVQRRCGDERLLDDLVRPLVAVVPAPRPFLRVAGVKVFCQADALGEILKEPPVDQKGRLIHIGVMLLHPVLHAEQSVGLRAELLHIPLPQFSVVSQLAGDTVLSAPHG